MPNIIYCNSFEVSHTKEAFCMIIKFQKPDGSEICFYVVTSPQGCKTLLNVLAAEMTEYEKEFGKVEPWNAPKNSGNPNNSKNPLIS